MPLPGVYWLTTLLGMSENSRQAFSGTQTGPSAHLKPSATLMILASFGINWSKSGIEPFDLADLGPLGLERVRNGRQQQRQCSC